MSREVIVSGRRPEGAPKLGMGERLRAFMDSRLRTPDVRDRGSLIATPIGFVVGFVAGVILAGVATALFSAPAIVGVGIFGICTVAGTKIGHDW